MHEIRKDLSNNKPAVDISVATLSSSELLLSLSPGLRQLNFSKNATWPSCTSRTTGDGSPMVMVLKPQQLLGKSDVLFGMLTLFFVENIIQSPAFGPRATPQLLMKTRSRIRRVRCSLGRARILETCSIDSGAQWFRNLPSSWVVETNQDPEEIGGELGEYRGRRDANLQRQILLLLFTYSLKVDFTGFLNQ